MTETRNRHLDVKVEGKVQGVFFRVAAQSKAHELGLTGYASNKDDHVYIEVEGDADKIEKFIEWCWQGSSSAKVTSVQANESGLQGFEHFKVK
jgi:acylphosphatase